MIKLKLKIFLYLLLFITAIFLLIVVGIPTAIGFGLMKLLDWTNGKIDYLTEKHRDVREKVERIYKDNGL